MAESLAFLRGDGRQVLPGRRDDASRVRTALVGCGKVGQIHAEALASLPESEFVAACDAEPDRAEALRRAVRRPRRSPTSARCSPRPGPRPSSSCTPHPLHAGPAVAGGRGRGPRPGREADGREPGRLRRHARRRAARPGVTLGVVSQRRFYEPVRRMKAAIDAGKIGRPVLGVFAMFNWRDEAYYRSDPWRGRWDTEGGGVLVNQSPHQLDLLQWFMGEVDEVSGDWANLNHPDDRGRGHRRGHRPVPAAAASARSSPACRRSRACSPRSTSTGRTGRRSASRPTAARRSSPASPTIAEPPLNDLWTVPGEEHLLAEFQAEDRARFAADRRHDALPRPPDPRLPPRRSSKAARRWSRARTAARSSPCSRPSTARTANGRPIEFPLRAEDGDGRP